MRQDQQLKEENKKVEMHRILFWPDIRLIQNPDTEYLAGYPVRAGPDIRPNTRLENYIFGKISNESIKQLYQL
jgi:hypothetical protein